jgi:hypothetical protein
MTLNETLKQLKALGSAKVRVARIESEMAEAEPEVQWTMNNTLADRHPLPQAPQAGHRHW